MRRLMLTALLAVAAFTGTTHATDEIRPPSFYDCYGVDAGGTETGACAGIVCWDLCGPTLIVDPYCRQSHGPYLATCVVVDELGYRSR